MDSAKGFDSSLPEACAQSEDSARSSQEWEVVDPTEELPTFNPKLRARWVKLLSTVIMRKKWAVKGHALNYAKNGLPKSVDGKATGLGSHLGRWSFRDMRCEW